MTKNENINIKLEVFKDKFSGKISLIAHFNHSAPNIYKERDDYVWFPTTEEKNLILEAFDLTSSYSHQTFQEKTVTQPQPKQVITSSVETQTTREMEPKLNIQQSQSQHTKKEPAVFEEQNVIKTNQIENQKVHPLSYNTPKTEAVKKEEQKTADHFPKTQPREKVPTIFDVPTEIKTYDTKKETESDESYYKQNQEEVKKEESYVQTYNNKKDLDEAVISEADINAIDAALKKQTEKEEYMVQADEKTIVDKVLNQKKKGKWNKM